MDKDLFYKRLTDTMLALQTILFDDKRSFEDQKRAMEIVVDDFYEECKKSFAKKFG